VKIGFAKPLLDGVVARFRMNPPNPEMSWELIDARGLRSLVCAVRS
jgi:hypothetical protein